MIIINLYLLLTNSAGDKLIFSYFFPDKKDFTISNYRLLLFLPSKHSFNNL